MPFIIISVILGLIALSTGYVTVDLAGLNKQKALPSTVISTPAPNDNFTVSPSDLMDPVKNFYSFISSKQYDTAWSLLSKNFQNYAQNYDNFVNGYKTTLNTHVKDIRIQGLSDNTVFVQLESSDNINGYVQTKTFEGIWKLAPENGQWKLDTADITLKSVSSLPKTANVPTPTITSTPVNTSITHDGSRTGAFVQYNEWATGQKIQIYENELLPYTFPNGNQTYMTKGDIAWFEKNAKPNLVNYTNNSPSAGGYYPALPPFKLNDQSDQNNYSYSPGIGNQSLKYNAFENRWEITDPGSSLKYNPFENSWSYE